MPVEPAIAEIWKRAPLVRFSVYSQLQVEAVRALSTELVRLLDASVSHGRMEGPAFQTIYAKFWLWVLAAYEITRTMSEYRICFSERFQAEIASFKKNISVLRIPFAKQQFQGEKKPIGSEASVYGLDTTKKDLAFRIGDKEVWMRQVVDQFEGMVGSLTAEDVLCDLRNAKKG